jgi:hypothetical protein
VQLNTRRSILPEMGQKDGVQNHTIKKKGCKIAQLAKNRGKSAIKPKKKINLTSNENWWS